ncbi:MAG: hypothetical protein KGZ45_04290 [Clostridium sp.]|nr:hypothetical protein [Clostridium sp.]
MFNNRICHAGKKKPKKNMIMTQETKMARIEIKREKGYSDAIRTYRINWTIHSSGESRPGRLLVLTSNRGDII